MALCRSVGFVLKAVKPTLVNPCYILPSSVNLQVRHAARKGYREKAQRAKKAAALAALQTPQVKKEVSRLKKKYTRIQKTVDLKKPEPPNDDVFIQELFNYKKYTISEAISFHREYHHPEVYNNPNAPISLKIEINMTAKKSTQFLKPFNGIATIPHPFVLTHAREILVLCNAGDIPLALSAGATVAGSEELVQKIKEGAVQPKMFDYVIAHTNFLPQLTPIRNTLKDQMPRLKTGTLTQDLKSSIYRFAHGIEYSCIKIGSEQDFGFIDCILGTLAMDVNHLEENFKALVADIEKNRPAREGDFISWVWCVCKPSHEEFSIDLTKYLDTGAKTNENEEPTELKEEAKMNQ